MGKEDKCRKDAEGVNGEESKVGRTVKKLTPTLGHDE